MATSSAKRGSSHYCIARRALAALELPKIRTVPETRHEAAPTLALAYADTTPAQFGRDRVSSR